MRDNASYSAERIGHIACVTGNQVYMNMGHRLSCCLIHIDADGKFEDPGSFMACTIYQIGSNSDHAIPTFTITGSLGN